MHISWSFCACSVGLDSSNSSPTTVAWHPHQKSIIVIGKAFHPSIKYHRHCIGGLCGFWLTAVILPQVMSWAEWLWRTFWNRSLWTWRPSTLAEWTSWPSQHTGDRRPPAGFSPLIRCVAAQLKLCSFASPAPPCWRLSVTTAPSLCWTLNCVKCKSPHFTLNNLVNCLFKILTTYSCFAGTGIGSTRTLSRACAGSTAAPTHWQQLAGTTLCFTTQWLQPLMLPTRPHEGIPSNDIRRSESVSFNVCSPCVFIVQLVCSWPICFAKFYIKGKHIVIMRVFQPLFESLSLLLYRL